MAMTLSRAATASQVRALLTPSSLRPIGSQKAAFSTREVQRIGRRLAQGSRSGLLTSTRQKVSSTSALGSLYASPILSNTSRSISFWSSGSKRTEPVPDTSGESVKDSLGTAQQSVGDHIGNVPEFPTYDTLAHSAHEAQETMAHATEQVQTLAEMGELSSWPNVRAAQGMLDWLVEATGLPWWVTIVAVTLTFRALVLPVVLYGQKNAIRMANVQPKMQTHMKDIQYAKDSGDNALLAKSVQNVQQLLKDNDCHPLRSLVVPLVQAPMFMTFFFALRGLGEAGLHSMKTGGFAWFTDLSAADPYFILPVLSTGLMLISLETGAELGGASTAQNNQQAAIMRWVMRGIVVATLPFIYAFPAAVFCYWVTNGIVSLGQLLLLHTKFAQRVFGMPQKAQPSREDRMIKAQQARSGRKDMSFWDAVGSGMTSQENPATVRVVRRNQAPSVLQSQREMHDGREKALKRLQEFESKKKNGKAKEEESSS